MFTFLFDCLLKVLQDGETILVDTNCISKFYKLEQGGAFSAKFVPLTGSILYFAVAFAGSCKLDLKRAGGVLGIVGGGEGIFNTTYVLWLLLSDFCGLLTWYVN